MDEQRYVVVITRPVPPEKVAHVAQRIAERLNVPVERIVTLLDGRVGEVTKPVLADKADAITEVFAEAGVSVVIDAARIDPPAYRERFGDPNGHGYVTDQAPDEPVQPDLPEEPSAPDSIEDDDVPWDQEGTWGFDADAAQQWSRQQDEPHSDPEAADDVDAPRIQPPVQPTVQPPDQPDELSAASFSDDDDDYQPYESQEDSYDGPYDEPYEEPFEESFEQPYDQLGRQTPVADAGAADADAPDASFEENTVPEEEADRLGPTPRRLRVAYEEPPVTLSEEDLPPSPCAGVSSGHGAGDDATNGMAPPRYAASTRWTPSPHDPYAFAPEDAPGYEGRRATPVGPARTTPLEPLDREDRADHQRDSVGGFFSPEEEPRGEPRLRIYLLWALAVSLLVLVLLQFVMALRPDGVGGAPAGTYESGLEAYRKGDFVAARKTWEPIAEAGNARAQYFLGFMLQNGMGQDWSNARAAGWYQRAAQQGLPEAQLALGDLYIRGMGVPLDPAMGATWYASAASGGDPMGQFEYAKLLLHGVGVPQDLNAAYAWFEAAAAAGLEVASDYVDYAHLGAFPVAQDNGAP